MAAGGALSVREIRDGRGLQDWLGVPHTVFRGDPAWIAPLDLHERQRISPKHNAFFSFGEAAFFVAYRGEMPVGRISAQMNRTHLAHHSDGTGHFGFFDCLDDAAAARALTGAAADWLAARGLKRMLGPFHLSINEDIGLLVDGFDEPPAILSSHAPSWAGRLLETAGFEKAMDLFAYRASPKKIPREIERLARLARDSGRVKVRQIEMAHYQRELALIFDIYNDAWSGNWGFVPIGEAEIAAIGKEMRPIMRGKYGRVAEIDGVPAAMMIVLPDLNRVIAPFGGKLMPFNWARLAHAIWQDRWTSARIPLLGVRKEFRATPIAPAVLSLLVSELLTLGRDYDLDWIEFSWVLEINTPMVKLAELAAGPPCRTYRIYAKALK